jgi:ATP-dependent exoDNAse (exonuclease V) alpha subunit
MPLYRLQINSISRSAGRKAIAAAAYRAGERIRDERTGKLHNYASRKDVRHTEIILPSALKDGEAGWARDRSRLWNAAEAAEHRRDSRVAREYQVALPHELSAPQRLELARRFSRELADRHNIGVDLAIHDPRPDSDPRSYHAHLLVTTREVGPAGFGGKAGLDLSISENAKRGLAGAGEMTAIRERWASMTNEAYRAAGLDLRVDHRSLAAQGIDREPQPKIPFQLVQMERRGVRSEVAERIRAAYRERVAARAARQGRAAGAEPVEQSAEQLAPQAQAVEDVRRQAREAWMALRREALGASAGRSESAQPDAAEDHAPERAREAERTADEDLGL